MSAWLLQVLERLGCSGSYIGHKQGSGHHSQEGAAAHWHQEGLGYVTSQLSHTAASLTEEYTDTSGSFDKLQFEEVEIDFVAASSRTDVASERG